MRKAILILCLTLLVISCQKKVTPEDIATINGYWEIEKVVFPDGNQKEYTINETFDYFEIKNNKGFRKKVMPQLDGTFLANDDSEKLEIKEEKGTFFIYYNTSFNKWKEELVAISDQELIVINDSKNEYHYKRATPLNIIPNGKKTK